MCEYFAALYQIIIEGFEIWASAMMGYEVQSMYTIEPKNFNKLIY